MKWSRLSMAGAAAATASLPAVAVAQSGPEGRYYHMMWDGGWLHWIFGPLMMLLFLVAAVGIVVVVLRWLGGAPTSAPRIFRAGDPRGAICTR